MLLKAYDITGKVVFITAAEIAATTGCRVMARLADVTRTEAVQRAAAGLRLRTPLWLSAVGVVPHSQVR